MSRISKSRFRLSERIDFDGKQTFGRWVEPSFMRKPPQQVYIVPAQFAKRVDLISNFMYGSPQYYWAIVAYNAPRNPLNWPEAGETIRIPDLQQILVEL